VGEDRSLGDGKMVAVGGMVTTVKKMVDKNGRTWAAFTIEDLTGSIEVLAFAKTFDKYGEIVNEDAKLLVTGRLAADNRRGGRGSNGGNGGEDEESASGEGEVSVYKIMADEIEAIDASEAVEPTDAIPAPLVAQPVAESNGQYENGGSAVSLPESVAGITSSRNGASGGYTNGKTMNGHSANGHAMNGHSVNGTNGSNGHGANGHSGANNGANGHSGDTGGVEYSRYNGPQHIGRTFAPPPSAAGCVHLHIGEDYATAETLSRLWNICRNHHGDTEVWLHIDNGVEMMQLRVSHAYWVDASPEFCNEVLAVLGEGCVLVPC
jgi:hypothetical protein